MKFSKAVAAAMLVAGAIGDVHAGMLGAIGPTYPIAEPDAVAQIMAKLRAKERSGGTEAAARSGDPSIAR